MISEGMKKYYNNMNINELREEIQWAEQDLSGFWSSEEALEEIEYMHRVLVEKEVAMLEDMERYTSELDRLKK